MTRKERKSVERRHRQWERSTRRKFPGTGGQLLIATHPLTVGNDWDGKRAQQFLGVLELVKGGKG